MKTLSSGMNGRSRGAAAMLSRLALTIGLIAGVLAAPTVATAQDQTQTAPPEGAKYEHLIKVRTAGGVVVSESMQASQAGIDVLDAGGNAVDAAIATTYAIGVTRPEMCGIGGGGSLLYRGADGSTAALDFRETAPAAMDQNTFNEASSGGATDKVKQGIHNDVFPSGHTVVGVPGIVAGMEEAFNVLGSGSVPLAELIAPAERYAREGIKVSINLQLWFFLDSTLLGQRLYNYPETARVYGGRMVYGSSMYHPWVEDPTAPGGPAGAAAFKQEDYAKSLRLIMEHGRDAFYTVDEYVNPLLGTTVPQPSIGKLIVDDMAEAEDNAKTNAVLLAKTAGTPNDIGLITERDLGSYEPVWRTPLRGHYRDHEVITTPPPMGGMVVLETLNLLENFELSSFGHSSTDHIHALAEAQKLAWADRIEYLTDPDFESVPADILTSKRYAQQRVGEIDMAKAKSVAEYGPGTLSPPHEGMHTTHLSVIDSEGNAASVTCTLNSPFGSGVVAPGTGFLLNNELADFDWCWQPEDESAPTDPNDPCVAQGVPANVPAGGKRPRSAMSPTIVVKQNQPVLVTGGAGGPTIIGGVVQQVINVVDFDLDIFRAIDAARADTVAANQAVSAGCTPGRLMLESSRIDDTVEAALQGRGHVLCHGTARLDYGGLPLIASAGTDLLTGERLAVSDPRALAKDNYDQGPMGQQE